MHSGSLGHPSQTLKLGRFHTDACSPRTYVVEGTLPTPDGRNPRVRAIWFIREGEHRPRLVTAYPVEVDEP